jgi:hypothetical protein
MAANPTKKLELMSPRDLVIVGIDTGHKIGDHPLVDERVVALNPTRPDPGLLGSIRKLGVTVPILARREKLDLGNGPERCVVVVAGRNRVICARALNSELPAEEALRIKVSVEPDDDDRAIDVMVAENAARLGDNVMTRARRAVRLTTVNGRSLEEVATIEAVDVATIRRWRKLVKLPKAAQKAVEQGKLSANVALRALAKIKDVDEQLAALQTLLDDHAQTKLAPSLKRAEALLSGTDPENAPVRSAKPKVSMRHLTAIRRYSDDGRLAVSSHLAPPAMEALMQVIEALTNPDFTPTGEFANLLEAVGSLQAEDKAALKAERDVERFEEREAAKATRAARRAEAKEAKDQVKAEKKAQKAAEKAAQKATLAAEAAEKARIAAAAAGVDIDHLALAERDVGEGEIIMDAPPELAKLLTI